MGGTTGQISHWYLQCMKLFLQTGLDHRDLQLWGAEFEVAGECLDRRLRRSKSLRQLLLSHLSSLRRALVNYVALQTNQEQIQTEVHIKANELIAAEVYDLLCLSSELRDPSPSDNLELLSASGIRDDTALEIERASKAFPDAAENLQRRIGIISWIRKREIESVHKANARTIPIYGAYSMTEARHSVSLNPHLRRDVLKLAKFFVMIFDHCPLCVKPNARAGRYDDVNHLLADLEPYICTFGNCSQAFQIFTRSEWEEHETLFHKLKSSWVCYLCQAPFNTRQSFLDHVELKHPKWAVERQLQDKEGQPSKGSLASQPFLNLDLVQLSEQRLLHDPGQGACPLCTQHQISNLTDHVAVHLETLSLQMLQESKIIGSFITTIASPHCSTETPPDYTMETEASKVGVYGSWIGGGKPTTKIPVSPVGRLWIDIKKSANAIRLHPSEFLTFRFRRSNLYHEMFPTFMNLLCVTAHFILFLDQLIFLALVPLLLFLPLSIAPLLVIILLSATSFVSAKLNGSNYLIHSSHLPMVHSLPGDSEKWFFINGALTGSHWLRLNINRLATTFGRPVTGIHNKTYGIIFDLVQTLIQRNFGYVTASTRVCFNILQSELYSPDTSKIVLVLHGQGAIEGSLALDLLLQEVPRNLFSKLEIYTFGSAAAHFNNPYRNSLSAASTDNNLAPRPRVLGHIEHYALSRDFSTLISPLLSTKNTIEDDQGTSPNFVGQIFEMEGTGSLFNGDYMDSMFPLRPLPGDSQWSLFMEQNPEIEKDPQRENPLLKTTNYLDSDSNLMDRVVEEGPSGSRELGVGSVQVKDLSRLWQYRDGLSPPPSQLDVDQMDTSRGQG